MATWSTVGLVGYAGAGKDTAAAGMERVGFVNLKFAGPLKAMLRALLRMQNVSVEQIDRMINGDLKELPSAELSGQTPRHAMQTLGTEWGRDCMAEDFWTYLAMVRAFQCPRAVFSDCRFPNEAARIREMGGKIVRIERPGLEVDLSHPSEKHVDTITYDMLLTNDTDTPEQFSDLVAGWFQAAVERGDA